MKKTTDKRLIDRILHLNQESDRCYLIERLKLQPTLPTSREEVERAILFLSDKLDEEWLTVYPLDQGEVSIKVGPKSSQGLDFFSEVVPLGLALIALSGLEKFERLVEKLEIQSNERLSSILEALSAARYMKKGYEVELEPSTEKGRCCDFRVRFGNEWIYFECKKEYPRESRYYKSFSSYANRIIDKILMRVESKLPPTYRIDVIVLKRVRENTLDTLIDKICECLDVGEFNHWKQMEGMKFAVNSRKTVAEPPPLCVRLMRMKIGTTPTKVSEESAHIQVIYNPFGSKELRKMRRIIREANNQLPRTSRGIIILETQHSERVVRVAEEKLREPRYGKVIAILVVGDKVWSAPNALHQKFPLDFLKIAVFPDVNKIISL